MDKQTLNQVWDQTRQKYGVYLRLLEAIPEDRYHSHPVPGMRSFAELVAHVSGSIVRDITSGVAKGVITVANAAVAATGDAQLTAMVPTPWGMTIPGWVGYSILGDEFLHHRGQLYAYARVFGVEPPFIWGFRENAAEFRPSA